MAAIMNRNSVLQETKIKRLAFSLVTLFLDLIIWLRHHMFTHLLRNYLTAYVN